MAPDRPTCPREIAPCAPEPAGADPRHVDDHQLVRRALDGDERARQLVTARCECIDRMLGARNRRLGRPLTADELEDVGQDVRVIVWRRLSDYRPIAALSSWIFGICEFQLRNAVRSKRRAPAQEHDPQRVEQLVAPSHGTASFFDHVHVGLATLAEADQRLLRLKHFDGLTLQAIAARLDTNLNTIKSRYARALQQLRRAMSRHGEEERG